MKPSPMIQLIAGLTLSAAPILTFADLPGPKTKPEPVPLAGPVYQPLVNALSNFYEVPSEDRVSERKSAAAERALDQVRNALKKLDHAPGVPALPVKADMTSDEMARALGRVRLAQNVGKQSPYAVVYYLFPLQFGAGFKVIPYVNKSEALSLDETRARNPFHDVVPMYYDTVGAMR